MPKKKHYSQFMSITTRRPYMQPIYPDITESLSPVPTIDHLICLSLMLFLPLLFLVFLFVVALRRLPPGCSWLSLSGLPGGVPSTFACGFTRFWVVGVWIRVYLQKSESGGGGGHGDHCRRCHGENATYWCHDQKDKERLRRDNLSSHHKRVSFLWQPLVKQKQPNTA